MRKCIHNSMGFLLALLLILGLIPAPVMAENTPTKTYTTHVQNVGWQDFVFNGTMSGTEGKSYRFNSYIPRNDINWIKL